MEYSMENENGNWDYVGGIFLYPIIVVSILFSIIPINPQYNPYIIYTLTARERGRGCRDGPCLELEAPALESSRFRDLGFRDLGFRV